MAQQVRAGRTLENDLSIIPSIHSGLLATACNSPANNPPPHTHTHVMLNMLNMFMLNMLNIQHKTRLWCLNSEIPFF